MEERFKSETLDAFRDLVIFSGKGDMSVEISNIKEGWGMQPNTSEVNKFTHHKSYKVLYLYGMSICLW